MATLDQFSPTTPLTVAIVGAGMSGLCMAIALAKINKDVQLRLYEKASTLGGTWRENTYPGSGCDVPSFLYSFSFEPNPSWTRKFATQPEILAYMNHCAEKYEILPHIEFNAEVGDAHFEQTTGLWHFSVNTGPNNSAEPKTAHVLIMACGQLNRPGYPKLPGIDCFNGKQFHSALWDHDYSLADKTVAVVGTGASAIQFIPHIAEQVKKLVIFQRSPNWIIPKPDRPFKAFETRLFKSFSVLAKFYRLFIYWHLESRFVAFFKHSLAGRIFQWVTQRQMKNQLHSPALQHALQPDYPIGCKRILISNDYLGTLNRDNVEVLTDNIDSIDETGINIGQQHFDSDAIIYATGFQTTAFLAPVTISGKDNTSLESVWQNGANAHLGMTVSGFPNFFILYGPNTNLGHNSIIFMVECQVSYIKQCIEALIRNNWLFIDVRADVLNEFNDTVQSAAKNSVWDSQCTNWYKTTDGKIINNWPSFTFSYWWKTRYPKFSQFDCQPRALTNHTLNSPENAKNPATPGLFSSNTLNLLQKHLKSAREAF